MKYRVTHEDESVWSDEPDAEAAAIVFMQDHDLQDGDEIEVIPADAIKQFEVSMTLKEVARAPEQEKSSTPESQA